MATTVIHVNQHVIRRNVREGTDEPCIAFRRKAGGRATYARVAAILDGDGREVARVVYRPDRPLPCGARCWVETGLRVVALA
jgi:hypothetical protein